MASRRQDPGLLPVRRAPAARGPCLRHLRPGARDAEGRCPGAGCLHPTFLRQGRGGLGGTQGLGGLVVDVGWKPWWNDENDIYDGWYIEKLSAMLWYFVLIWFDIWYDTIWFDVIDDDWDILEHAWYHILQKVFVYFSIKVQSHSLYCNSSN